MPCSQAYGSQVGGHTTKGGYSDHVVVREEFVLHVPDSLSMAGTAPLLCAGITGVPQPTHSCISLSLYCSECWTGD